ncbi:MAG: hypothetical protein ACNA7K_06290 [Acholeplasmataceae bacterium]
MAILRRVYVAFGFLWYVFINIISYTMPLYEANITLKIIFSFISLILFIGNGLIILETKRLFKKPFEALSLHTKIIVSVGVIVIPLVSLYY